jgi:DNA-damage-inducible protein D
MAKRNLVTFGNKSFEDLKQVNEHGAEYWSARELLPLLGYSQWRRFEDAIKRAITSCKQSENIPENHFAGVGKMIDLGSGSSREIPDYHLSSFACCLIARKPEMCKTYTEY